MDASKLVGEGLTYDDVLIIPAYSEVLPSQVSISTRLTRNITLNTPIISAAMDTVTESALAIAMAQMGGIGVIHKNMSIEDQAWEVRKVKRSESGMIKDPVTLNKDALVGDALKLMSENKIGGIKKPSSQKVFGLSIHILFLRILYVIYSLNQIGEWCQYNN